MAQRTTGQTLAWFNTHQTKAQLRFDPDGQCLKVARTARNIGAKYPSAIAAQHATPLADRRSLSKIAVGMVAFFDDPHDDNPYGHIATVAAVAPRVLSLADIAVWTNSVKKDSLVKVRGDYFQKNWGDEFQFAATSLNGVKLLLPGIPPPAKPAAPAKPVMPELRDAIKELRVLRDRHQKAGHTRIVNALNRDISELVETLKKYAR